jgi:hypothetical protein
MNNVRITPVDLVIQSFGGVRAAARVLKLDPATVSRWQQSGRVPAKRQENVLQLAWERGIDLTAHDLIFGRQP